MSADPEEVGSATNPPTEMVRLQLWYRARGQGGTTVTWEGRTQLGRAVGEGVHPAPWPARPLAALQSSDSPEDVFG